MGVVADARVLVIGVEQRQVERLRKINGEEAEWQEAFRCIGIVPFTEGLVLLSLEIVEKP